MAENSKIEWCDHTFNPWIGCAKVHAGCANCYAEADFDKRRHRAQWGPAGTRVLTSETTWSQPLKWDKWALEGVCPRCKGKGVVKVPCELIPCDRCAGSGNIGPYRARVFCASLADVFEAWEGPIQKHDGCSLWRCPECRKIIDGAVPEKQSVAPWCYQHTATVPLTMQHIRIDLFTLIDQTPHLDWLLLTKRPENIRGMWASFALMPPAQRVDYALEFPSLRSIPDSTTQRPYRPNVWLGTSISDQASADRQIAELLKCRDLSPVLFLSAEPLLGPVDLTNVRLQSGRPINALNANDALVPVGGPSLDWVICGGESGPNARPMHPAWARSLRDQCQVADVPFHFKQWGEWAPATCTESGLQIIGASGIAPRHPAVYEWPDGRFSLCVGKKVAGRLLDLCEWNELPTVC